MSSPLPAPGPSLSRYSLAELETQITELAGQLNAANYRWLTLIGEFDRRQGWADGSLHSCAHWLNFKCGLDLGAAREKVRVASALPGVPKIAAAMARGELSYSKVRALTRVATPATEENLLMLEHGPALPAETVRRLACDASLIRIVETERGEPLDVGRKTRGIPWFISKFLPLPTRSFTLPTRV